MNESRRHNYNERDPLLCSATQVPTHTTRTANLRRAATIRGLGSSFKPSRAAPSIGTFVVGGELEQRYQSYSNWCRATVEGRKAFRAAGAQICYELSDALLWSGLNIGRTAKELDLDSQRKGARARPRTGEHDSEMEGPPQQQG